ncbi:MAG: TonB-dependent receptor [Myxococcota bacterium]|nr:TonB-dependent receptor [Myxococcota bacterium]
MRLSIFLYFVFGLSTALAQSDGRLRLFVFDGDRGHVPYAKLQVSVNGQVAGVTNADGRFQSIYPSGKLSLIIGASTGVAPRLLALSDVPIVDGEVTEVIVTVWRDKAADVATEHHPDLERQQSVAEDTSQSADAQGALTGYFIGPNQRPLRGVQVFVRGRSAYATSDEKGAFRMALSTGQHTLSFIRTGYRIGRRENVSITARTTTDLGTIALEPSRPSLEDFVVSVPYIEGGLAGLASEKRETSHVVETLGAEQMARSGDSDAASALGRVTGLTIVGGRYVFVRGMGDRYSSTRLNGMFLPSPEPERRVIPLDLFPTGILSAVLVQKTYSPDQPGEFGGGVIQLRTRGIPEKSFVTASVSTGYRFGTTLTKRDAYDGGELDWLGIDDGTRALPADVQQSIESTSLRTCSRALTENCLTFDELTDLGRSFPEGWNKSPVLVPPDISASVAGGYTTRFGAWRLGTLASLSYSQDWQYIERSINTFRITDNVITTSDRGVVSELTRTLSNSGIVEVNLKRGKDHHIGATTLLLRNTDDQTSLYEGTNLDERSDVQVSRLRWVERGLFTQQLRGAHQTGQVHTRWHYGYSVADRLEPNRRIYQYDRSINTDDPYTLSFKPEGNRRFYSDLDDSAHDTALALRYDFGERVEGQSPPSLIEIGANHIARERQVETRRFKFEGPTDNPDDLDKLFRSDKLWNDPGHYSVANTTQATDDYSAEQTVTAAYLMSEVDLPFQLRAMAGLRVESGRQSVQTFSPFSGDQPVNAELDNTDVLPSGSLTWAFATDMQMRFGYGRTITRPEFRELSPARFDDVTNRRSVRGNPEVGRGMIDHYDARFEWYLSPQQTVSLAAFYKSFTDPIETMVTCGADRTITYRNSPSARNVGAELSFRKDFQEVGARWLYLSGNFALIESSVDLSNSDGCETSSKRPLEGQSPYVVNLQLGAEHQATGVQSTLLYNVAGSRIVQVGTSGLPDAYAQSRHQLDVVLGFPIGAGFAGRVKVSNLLDSPLETRVGDKVESAMSDGRRVSVGVSYRFDGPGH